MLIRIDSMGKGCFTPIELLKERRCPLERIRAASMCMKSR